MAVIRDFIEHRLNDIVQRRTGDCVPLHFRLWQILLQKSFCITDCKFSGPYVRRSNSHLRGTTSYCDELAGAFGNGLEAISLCDFGSYSLFAGNWPHGILGVLQHYRPVSKFDGLTFRRAAPRIFSMRLADSRRRRPTTPMSPPRGI